MRTQSSESGVGSLCSPFYLSLSLYPKLQRFKTAHAHAAAATLPLPLSPPAWLYNSNDEGGHAGGIAALLALLQQPSCTLWVVSHTASARLCTVSQLKAAASLQCLAST